MNAKPVIFISAVSKELRGARQVVFETLARLGFEPLTQEIFPTEQGDISGIDKRKADSCDGVIQLVGHCYGFEPPVPDATFGRVSYTQHEALYARSIPKKVWYFLLAQSFPTDAHEAEPHELRVLQEKYRERIKTEPDLYHNITSTEVLKLRLHELEDKLEELRREWRERMDRLERCIESANQGIAESRESNQAQHQKIDSLNVGQTEMLQKINQLLAIHTGTPSQFNRLVRAFVRLPEVLGQMPPPDGKHDDPTRYAATYARLEREEALPIGTLDKELPGFSQWLLQRPDLDPLVRVQAVFVAKNFIQAEKDALAAERTLAAQEHETRARRIQALMLAGLSARAQILYHRALEHFYTAAALTDLKSSPMGWADVHHMMAAVLDDLGRGREAELIMRKVLLITDREMGADHPDTLASRGNLANSLS